MAKAGCEGDDAEQKCNKHVKWAIPQDCLCMYELFFSVHLSFGIIALHSYIL